MSRMSLAGWCRGMRRCFLLSPGSTSFFFFNDPTTTEIYTLSLHDALPISTATVARFCRNIGFDGYKSFCLRSEEHTSELQSHVNLVCRLLLEKKKNKSTVIRTRRYNKGT